MKAYTKMLPEGYSELRVFVNRAEYQAITARTKEDQKYYRNLASLLNEALRFVEKGLPPVEWEEEGEQ